jgi:GT2 family glycosyltransferase
MNGIVYLTYNSSEQIRYNFNKLVTNLSKPTRLKIIDNASVDNSAKLLSDAGYDVEVNENNNGFSAGINQGIRDLIANGVDEWVFIVNPDVVCCEKWDEKLLKLSQNTKCGIIGATLLDRFGKIVHSGGIIRDTRALLRWPALYPIGNGLHVVSNDGLCATHFVHDDGRYDASRKCYWVTFAVAALNVKMINDIGMLDEKYFLYSSDSSYCMRAWQAGWEVWCSNTEFTHHTSSSLHTAPKETQDKLYEDTALFVHEEEDLWLLSRAGISL